MQPLTSYDMYVPTRTLFGAGMLNELHKQALPGKKALLVISNGKSTRANGYLERTCLQLEKAGASWQIYDGISANPVLKAVDAGGKAAREAGCDFIVALGGGSVMDAAKAIAVMATSPGTWWDYVQAGTGGRKPFAEKPLPIVAITTTAGTGSETDMGLVISNPDTNEKIGMVNPLLFPVLAIVDPELMLSVPPLFTAYQGFDALFHAVEGYISQKANIMSDMYAEKAISSIAGYLPACVKNGQDIEARAMVAFGNTLSGTIMCVGLLTSEHSLEHALSGYHESLPHGAGLIMISLAYFRYFIEAHVCDERFIKMARLMGIKNAERPEDFLVALKRLQAECGVADLKMSDYGITPDEFPKMVKNARQTMARLFAGDRKALSDADCVRIYSESYK